MMGWEFNNILIIDFLFVQKLYVFVSSISICVEEISFVYLCLAKLDCVCKTLHGSFLTYELNLLKFKFYSGSPTLSNSLS